MWKNHDTLSSNVKGKKVKYRLAYISKQEKEKHLNRTKQGHSQIWDSGQLAHLAPDASYILSHHNEIDYTSEYVPRVKDITCPAPFPHHPPAPRCPKRYNRRCGV